ncbi:Ig-like domain-containing protein [Belliella marina]|uniref:Ig-like domain-containing protein n=1 Tax=Belliella marina TaxID=1644146 RepID=A0ABW4VQ01_9BACT
MFGADYYFSTSDGDDSRRAVEAQNPDTPWKTIEKLNQIIPSLLPGDKVLFKRGDTFYGSVDITQSGTVAAPIVFGSFGSGDKPIISGFTEIDSWVLVGEGVFESTEKFSMDFPLKVVTISGEIQEIGRYPNFDDPNHGYLRIESISGNQVIGSSELNNSHNWEGADVVIRKNPWIIDKHPIQSNSGNQIGYTKPNQYNASVGYGFFIQNHIKTLDKQGEWFYDDKKNKLNVFFGSGNPQSEIVKISTVENVISLRQGVSYITFSNLDIQGGNRAGISIDHGQQIEVLETNISFTGNYAIYGLLSHELKVEKCRIFQSLNNAIFVANAGKDVVIRDNEILDTYMFNGMGENSDMKGQAIYITSNSHNGLIVGNRIINTGYHGIYFGGNGTVVKNNFIDNFCVHKTDGGGIYTWEGPRNQSLENRVIEGNIIVNGLGYKSGTRLQGTINKPAVEGIYLDDNTAGVLIKNNTLANNSGNGIYIHNARNLVIQGNLLYNNMNQILFGDDNLGADIRNVSVENNTFFSLFPFQYFVKFSCSNNNSFENMGSFSNNSFASPFGTDFGFLYERFSSGTKTELLKSVKEWGRDKNAHISDKKLDYLKSFEIHGENLFANQGFDQNRGYTDCVGCSVERAVGGEFDGGYMKYNANRGSRIVFYLGKPEVKENYILRFTAKANKKAALEIYLRQDGNPWASMSKPFVFEVGEEKKTYEFAFFNEIEIEKAVLNLATTVDNLEIAIDDVMFHQAQVEFYPEESLIFQYNESSAAMKLPLPGIYNNVKNESYSGTVEIPSFSSVALIKVGDDKAKEDIPPTISILSPKNEDELEMGIVHKIEIEAQSEFSEIERIELYVGDEKIKEIENQPYTIEHIFDQEGDFTLKAKAIDKDGLETYSEPVSIKVVKPLEAPIISWDSPSNGDFFFVTEPITLSVTSDHEEQNIEKIDFLINNSVVGTVINAPYQITLPNLALGSYNLQAKATNSNGLKGETEVITINITEATNTPPTVSITSPSDNTHFTQGEAINIVANAQDSDGTVAKVEFYNGNTLLGTATSSPYSFNWDNAPAGTHTITAKATDDKGSVTTSAPINVQVGEKPNNPPTVSITSPSDNAHFTQGEAINIVANAQDSDGTVAKVEFYNGSTLLGTATSSPYSFNWDNAPAGTHTITAKATDDKGSVTTSEPINVQVGEKPNNPPTVSITSPSDNAHFTQGEAINIVANAQDSDGTVAKVEFYNGNTLLGTVTSSPYSFNWDNAPTGTHTITAKATDDKGSVTTSAPINVHVSEKPNTPPTVSITSPSDNAHFTQGEAINIVANAQDSDGTVAKVEFYNGNTLLGTATSSPYNFNWDNAPVGTHTITAKATDDKGAQVTSAPISIQVSEKPNTPPTVSITSPSDKALFTQGETINIVANAQDSDGTVTKVEFYNGSTLLGTATSSPYSFNWDNAPIGTHTITAKATDNKGSVTTSSPISIQVSEKQKSPSFRMISPVENEQYFYDENIELDVEVLAESSEIIKVEYFRNNIFIGSRTNGDYAYDWKVTVLGNVNITAIATDASGKTASDVKAINVVVRPNELPEIKITSPSDNSIFTVGEDITLEAEASDSDGYVAMVEFFNGSQLIGKTNKHPYKIDWNNLQEGSYNILARATDNQGGITTSLPIKINVIKDESLPEIELLSPTKNQVFEFGEVVDLMVMFKGDSKNVKSVEYYADSKLIGSSTESPYFIQWEKPHPGVYSISAKAIGVNPDNFRISEQNKITVNKEPIFRITSPVHLSEHKAGLDLKIEVETPITDKKIEKIEFYRGNTLIGSTNDYPYSLTWKDVPIGDVTLISRLLYEDGGILISLPVRIIVNNVPIVNLLTEQNKKEFAQSEKIIIKPEFIHFKGDISNVEYFVNGVSVGFSDSDPFGYEFTSLGIGIQEIWVEVLDSNGKKFTSEKIEIIVREIGNSGEINLDDFKIGPNPTNRYLNLIFNNTQESSRLTAEIVSINGTSINSYDFVLDQNEVTLDLENLLMGVYLLRIHYEGKMVITKRFVKIY